MSVALVPEVIPPFRLAYVAPGVLRGAYPTLRNFRALSRLRLRTIVSLTPETPTSDLKSFALVAGVDVVHIAVQRNMPIGNSLQALLLTAVNVCIDLNNHPVYVHCLDGRRITGLFVILLRRLQGWLPLSAISEYWRFQFPLSSRTPAPSVTEVEKNSREIEGFASTAVLTIPLPDRVPFWLRTVL